MNPLMPFTGPAIRRCEGSPRRLPLTVLTTIGEKRLRQAIQSEPYMFGGWCNASLHHGIGLQVRNAIRSVTDAWTDHELDDMWHLVVEAAAKYYFQEGDCG